MLTLLRSHEDDGDRPAYEETFEYASELLRDLDCDGAESSLHEALREARAASDDRMIGRILTNIGIVYAHRGGRTQCISAYRRALRHAEMAGDAEYIAKAAYNLGGAFGELDRFEDAVPFFARALAQAGEAIPEAVLEAARAGLTAVGACAIAARLTRAREQRAAGYTWSAVKEYSRARGIARVAAFPALWVSLTIELGVTLREHGVEEAACTLFRHALEMAGQHDDSFHVALAAARYATSLILAGRQEEALAVLVAHDGDKLTFAPTEAMQIVAKVQVEPVAEAVARAFGELADARAGAFCGLGLLVHRERVLLGVPEAAGARARAYALSEAGQRPWPRDRTCLCGASLDPFIFCACSPASRLDVPEAPHPSHKVVCDRCGEEHFAFACDVCGQVYSWQIAVVDSIGVSAFAGWDLVAAKMAKHLHLAHHYCATGNWWSALNFSARAVAPVFRRQLIPGVRIPEELLAEADRMRCFYIGAAARVLERLVLEQGDLASAGWIAEEAQWMITQLMSHSTPVPLEVLDVARVSVLCAGLKEDPQAVLDPARFLLGHPLDATTWGHPDTGALTIAATELAAVALHCHEESTGMGEQLTELFGWLADLESDERELLVWSPEVHRSVHQQRRGRTASASSDTAKLQPKRFESAGSSALDRVLAPTRRLLSELPPA